MATADNFIMPLNLVGDAFHGGKGSDVVFIWRPSLMMNLKIGENPLFILTVAVSQQPTRK